MLIKYNQIQKIEKKNKQLYLFKTIKINILQFFLRNTLNYNFLMYN